MKEESKFVINNHLDTNQPSSQEKIKENSPINNGLNNINNISNINNSNNNINKNISSNKNILSQSVKNPSIYQNQSKKKDLSSSPDSGPRTKTKLQEKENIIEPSTSLKIQNPNQNDSTSIKNEPLPSLNFDRNINSNYFMKMNKFCFNIKIKKKILIFLIIYGSFFIIISIFDYISYQKKTKNFLNNNLLMNKFIFFILQIIYILLLLIFLILNFCNNANKNLQPRNNLIDYMTLIVLIFLIIIKIFVFLQKSSKFFYILLNFIISIVIVVFNIFVLKSIFNENLKKKNELQNIEDIMNFTYENKKGLEGKNEGIINKNKGNDKKGAIALVEDEGIDGEGESEEHNKKEEIEEGEKEDKEKENG